MNATSGAAVAVVMGVIIAPLTAAVMYSATGGPDGAIAVLLAAFIAGVLYPVSLPFLAAFFVLFGRSADMRPAGFRLAAVLCGLAHPAVVIGAIVLLDRAAAGTTGIGPAPRVLAVVAVVLMAGAAVAWSALAIARRRHGPA